MTVRDRVTALREAMAARGLDAYLVPSTDDHQNEYLPEHMKRRQFITGFTGSAGDAVILREEAGLFTDSRYFLQAEQELEGTPFALFKLGTPGTPSAHEWLAKTLPEGSTAGIDPKVISDKEFVELEETLDAKGITLEAVEDNLVDALWEDRPEPPSAPILVHHVEYAGEEVEPKIDRLWDAMQEQGADAHVLTQLDAIAWLLDIRGEDVQYNPVVIAYVIVTQSTTTLYTDLDKVTPSVREALEEIIDIAPYEAFAEGLDALVQAGDPVMVDRSAASRWVVERLAGLTIVDGRSPVVDFKAIKNNREVGGIIEAHARDGAAMVQFLMWLESAVPAGGVTEVSAAEKLLQLREKGEGFMGPSFETISAYGGNGAVVHYTPSEANPVELGTDGLYLVDSGGQYLDGTTDITRTVCLGEPTAEQKDRYTRVLIGHIRLAMQLFPEGTAGKQLDTIARMPLWDVGLNFGHGVGHGVGHFLNVHEGPHALSYYRCTGEAFRHGMTVTIEPGYYEPGQYGIRIENLYLVVESEQHEHDGVKWFTFTPATLCPIATNLVDTDRMSPVELRWLDEYHEMVLGNLAPHLDDDALEWLERACAPLGHQEEDD